MIVEAQNAIAAVVAFYSAAINALQEQLRRRDADYNKLAELFKMAPGPDLLHQLIEWRTWREGQSDDLNDEEAKLLGALRAYEQSNHRLDAMVAHVGDAREGKLHAKDGR